MNLKRSFLLLCASVICILLLITFKKNPENLIENQQTLFLSLRYHLEPRCNESFAVWMITSSAEDFTSRIFLRRSYSVQELQKLSVKRIFLLGKPSKASHQKLIEQEAEKYEDILQGDFADVYRNLTVKHLMGLSWSSNNCDADFLIKTDDDIVLDLFKALKFIRTGFIERNKLNGYVLRKMPVVREPGNKWYVMKEEYEENLYPDFLSGWFYVTSLNIAKELSERSKKTSKRFFWIDDVYITGILREELKLRTKELNEYFATDYRYLECCVRAKKKRLKCDFIVGPDGGKPELQIRFKEFSDFCRTRCVERKKDYSVMKTCVAAYEEILKPKNGTAKVIIKNI